MSVSEEIEFDQTSVLRAYMKAQLPCLGVLGHPYILSEYIASVNIASEKVKVMLEFWR